MAAEISLTYKEDKNCEAECHQISEALNAKARVIFPACCYSPHTGKRQRQGRAHRRLHRKRAAAVPGPQPHMGLPFLRFNLFTSFKLWQWLNYSYWRLVLKVLNDLTLNNGERGDHLELYSFRRWWDKKYVKNWDISTQIQDLQMT